MILKILFAHALGDYFFQTDYLACNKGKDNYLLFIHSVLYTLAIYLFFGRLISNNEYWIILFSHIIIDYIKARGITPKIFGDKKSLILDQFIHYIILLMFLYNIFIL